MAALEQAISERNTLSSQNAQLWKLIEKQRSTIHQSSKDLERIRGERDAYKIKLLALGESTDLLLKEHRDKEKALKASSSNTGLRSGEKSSSAVSPGSVNLKPGLHRHHSDDPSKSKIPFLSSLILCHICILRLSSILRRVSSSSKLVNRREDSTQLFGLGTKSADAFCNRLQFDI